MIVLKMLSGKNRNMKNNIINEIVLVCLVAICYLTVFDIITTYIGIFYLDMIEINTIMIRLGIYNPEIFMLLGLGNIIITLVLSWIYYHIVKQTRSKILLITIFMINIFYMIIVLSNCIGGIYSI